jgi:hypothetical protein
MYAIIFFFQKFLEDNIKNKIYLIFLIIYPKILHRFQFLQQLLSLMMKHKHNNIIDVDLYKKKLSLNLIIIIIMLKKKILIFIIFKISHSKVFTIKTAFALIFLKSL